MCAVTEIKNCWRFMTNSGPKQENLLELEHHVAPYFCTWFVLNYAARPRENIGQHTGSCGYLIAAEVHRQLTLCVCVCVCHCMHGGAGEWTDSNGRMKVRSVRVEQLPSQDVSRWRRSILFSFPFCLSFSVIAQTDGSWHPNINRKTLSV